MEVERMKAQASTELMVIIAVILVVFIPLLVMVYMKADETQREMASYQAEFVVFRLAYLANSVGSLGSGTMTYTDIYVPKGTKKLAVKNVGSGAEIELKTITPQGEKDFAAVIKYPVTQDTVLMQEPVYGWARFKIANNYDDGKSTVSIEKAR